MSITIDSNAPYFTEFPINCAGDAVYMTAEDELLGNVMAIVYRAHRGEPKLSVILLGAHGTSGYVDMTLDRTSRYFGACRGLAPAHFKSPVRRALAIAVLRTYATMDKPLRRHLAKLTHGKYDESAAGSLGSRFRLVYGKFPSAIGHRVLDAGLISAKRIQSSVVDVIYEDSDETIDVNNELVYLLGEQLEQLFDPLSEYSPEPTEKVYAPPSEPPGGSVGSLDDEPQLVQDICEELYLLQAHARGDILDLLQSTLIPLRVEVLRGRFPGLTIARLNTVFPPTIDELFRVNNIFYEALRAALPYGSYEVIKACGTTIPYFFRACMRHEAATQNFNQSLADLLAEEPQVERYLRVDPTRIESVIQNSLHLTKVKLVLDRLAKTKAQSWTSPEQRSQIEEFHSVATGTVDAFGKRENTSEVAYDRRVFTSTGKLLGEIAQDWPAELEYGWLNRRVVTIFDAVDVLEPGDTARQLHVVFIVFTDALVVCRPTEPIPSTSLSGLHVPSVGDMLMHAMLNAAPLDPNLPPLKVVAWAPILDVHFASYDKQSLYVFSPNLVASYRLLPPDADADKLVSLLAKAKITTKTQAFHLFKVESPEATLFSTVQELQGYREEVNRTSIALFLSTEVTQDALDQFDLVGAVALRLNGDSVHVKVVSRMGYSAEYNVLKAETRDLAVSELSYLLTLSLSSQNAGAIDTIVASNQRISNQLIKWASQPAKTKTGHRRATVGVRKPQASSSTQVLPGQVSSAQLEHQEAQQQSLQSPQQPQPTRSGMFVIPSSSAESLEPVNHSLRKLPGKLPAAERDSNQPKIMPVPESDDEAKGSETQLDRVPTMADDEDDDGEIFYSSYSLSTQAEEKSLLPGHSAKNSHSSSEEAEQRDVDNWYHQLHNSTRDDASLSSNLSDVDYDFGKEGSQRSVPNSESIQIGGFLDRSASNLYNHHAGRAFPKLEESSDYEDISSGESQNKPPSQKRSHSNTVSSFESLSSLPNSLESTDESVVSGNTTVANGVGYEDFSYLASLVDATSFSSKLSELDGRGVYPDLRETSLVRLGSYILRTDKSQWNIGSDKGSDKGSRQVSRSTSVNDEIASYPLAKAVPRIQDITDADLDEATPTLKSGKFSALSPQALLSEDFSHLSRVTESPSASGDEEDVAPTPKITMKYTPFVDIEGVAAPAAVPVPTKEPDARSVYSENATEPVIVLNDSDSASETDEEVRGEDSFNDDYGTRLAQDWLAWTSASRPISMVSSRSINAFLADAADAGRPQSKLIESQSQISFRKMVMSSSLHGLQLASFAVQLDQRALSAETPEMASDLNRIKDDVAAIYNLRTTSEKAELIIRMRMTGYYSLLTKYKQSQLACGLLEVEWARRSRVSELHPRLVPTLWQYPEFHFD